MAGEDRAIQAQPVVTGIYESIGYRQVTVTNASQTLAALLGAAIPVKDNGAKAKIVRILPESGMIRFRDDGTDPTSTVGYPIFQLQEYEYDGDAIDTLELIRDTSMGANVTVSLWFLG